MHARYKRYLFFHIIAVCLPNIINSAIISRHPFNDAVTEGGVGIFTCVVKDIRPLEYVSWIFNGDQISKNDAVVKRGITDRFSVDIDTSLGIYTLKISIVKRSDEGQYNCCVYDENDVIVAESSNANLTVRQIPKAHYPICSPISASYIEGELVTLTCTTELTNPPSSISWFSNTDVLDSTEYLEGTSPAYVIKHTFNADKTHNRLMFICELLTKADRNFRRNCTIGPINVLYRPQVRIQQTDTIVAGEEAILICYSNANPSEVKYKWSFVPAIKDTEYKIENDRIVRILKASQELNMTRVICTVYNSIGMNSDELIIKVIIKKSHLSSIRPPEKEKKTQDQSDKQVGRKQELEHVGRDRKDNKDSNNFSLSLIVAVAVACIVVILGLAMIPVGYMRYTRRQPSDTLSRGRPVSIPDVYFEPKDHVDPMLPQLGLSVPWMRTVGVQVPGECEYDATYTQVSPQSRQAYYSQRMYTAASL